MEKALIIGRDINYVWALRKLLEKYKMELEHTFTISEAKVRINNFNYKFIILDNLKDFELDMFMKINPKNIPIIGVDIEYPKFLTIQKDISCPFMLSYLKENFGF